MGDTEETRVDEDVFGLGVTIVVCTLWASNASDVTLFLGVLGVFTLKLGWDVTNKRARKEKHYRETGKQLLGFIGVMIMVKLFVFLFMGM